jgi:hypothetical protein
LGVSRFSTELLSAFAQRFCSALLLSAFAQRFCSALLLSALAQRLILGSFLRYSFLMVSKSAFKKHTLKKHF